MTRIDWREASRWWSVRVSALGAILTALAAAAPDTLLQIWNGLPDDVRSILPEHLGRVVPTILFIMTLVVRLIPQKPEAERRSLWRSTSGRVAAKTAGSIAAAALAMIAGVIAIEGGYVNHPADPGGETNMGVTKAVAVRHGYTGPMRHLPRAVAESIYYRQYLVALGYARLVDVDAAVTEELFDTSVNMGPARPSRWFQTAINDACGTRLAIDGQVGPATVAAFAGCQAKLDATNLCLTILASLDARQRAEYDRLILANPKLRTFHRGWVAHRIGNVDRGKCKVRAA